MKRVISVAVALLAGVFPAAQVPAQAQRTDRQDFARVMQLRGDLLTAWLHATSDARQKSADALAADERTDVFGATAAAIAAARGVECTALDRLRAGLMLLAMPEVCDGDRFDVVHATLHSPRLLRDEFGELRFDFELRDAAGELVQATQVEGPSTVEDLARYRVTTELAFGERSPGRFNVLAFVSFRDIVRAPLGEVRVDLCPEFPARAEALPMLVEGTAPRIDHLRELVAALPKRRQSGIDRAVLGAVTSAVDRAYSGEPRLPDSDAIADLVRAEAVLDALRSDRDAVTALAKRITIAVPIGDHAGRVGEFVDHALVNLDASAFRVAPKSRELPLVLVVPGVPTWSIDARRASSPQTLHPSWMAAQLAAAGFCARGEFHVVVMESPGRFRSATGAVRDVVVGLRELLRVRGDRVFVIGEREGAYAAARAALDADGLIAAVVLVDGGAVTKRELLEHGGLHVAYALSHGSPSASTLTSMAAAAADTGRCELLPSAGVPWPIAIPAHTEVITTYLRSHLLD